MTWTLGPCKERARALEWSDLPDTGDDDLSHACDFMDFINRRLGGNRIVLNALEDSSKRWLPDMPISILDLRCGRGGLSRVIAAWARARKVDVRIFAADPNARLIRTARDRHREFTEIVFEVRDFDDPLFLQAQQFDYVVSSMSLHQSTAEQIVARLKTINRLAKRGAIVVDWLRDVRALAWMSFFARVWGDAIVRHDAPLAIRKGFSLEEAGGFAREAGMETALVEANFGYRFSIVAERGLEMSPEFNPLRGFAGT